MAKKKENKKNKWLKKLIAGFTKPTKYYEGKRKEKEQLKGLKKDIFYRGRPRFPSELIKSKNEKHRKKLNKQMEALGVTVLV